MPNALFYVNPPPKLPLEQIARFCYPHTLDEFETIQDPGTTITPTPTGITLTSRTTDNAQAAISLLTYNHYYDLTWNVPRELKLTAQITWDYAGAGHFEIGLFGPAFDPRATIRTNGSNIEAYISDGTNDDATTIYSLTEGETFTNTIKIHIKHYPTSHVEFYINGALQASLTNGVPTGDTAAEYMFTALVRAQELSNTVYGAEISLPYIEFYQAKS